jgi:hypothetical protein
MNYSTRDAVRIWLFKVLSAEDILDRMEQEGLEVRSGADPRALQRVLPLEDFSPEIRRAAMSALEAYLAFYCLENSIRELISERMQENHGTDWWAQFVSTPIADKVAKRQAAEGQNRWHIARGAGEICYTDFGDLKSILQSNWSDFSDLLPDQNWMLSRLTELEASRNIIAHMNQLDQRENDRLRIYLLDWVKQVG